MSCRSWANHAISAKCGDTSQDDFERTKLFRVTFRDAERCPLATFLYNWRMMNES